MHYWRYGTVCPREISEGRKRIPHTRSKILFVLFVKLSHRLGVRTFTISCESSVASTTRTCIVISSTSHDELRVVGVGGQGETASLLPAIKKPWVKEGDEHLTCEF